MKKIMTVLFVSLMSANVSVMAANDAAASKPVSCKAEAKQKGITDKKEISNYIKQCNKARAEAKKK